LRTLKKKENISLILDDEFIQYCELNKIEDIEKLASETFKKGFDLLKYGEILPKGVKASEIIQSEKIHRPYIPLNVIDGSSDNEKKKENPEVIVFPHSNSVLPNEEIKKEIKEKIQKLEKRDLYDE
jgi:hypothetical protein